MDMFSFRVKNWRIVCIIAIVLLLCFSPIFTNFVFAAEELYGLSGWRLDIFNILSSLGAFIAWMGGSLFDISIGLFTVGMVDTIIKLQLNDSITVMWGVVRDLFNILFIFGLIFAGFKIIIDANDSGSKRTIGSIVIAALLINFSLYIAQVVVDFSNVAAYQIDNLITTDETFTVLGFDIGSHSNAFTRIANVDTIGTHADEMAANAHLDSSETNTIGKAFVLGFLFLIFYTILGFVLGAGAVILFTRFFALIFLMIFSPIMFVGFIFPKMQKYSSQWWGYFFNQALVGPAFLFMIYLTLRALDKMSGLGDTTIMSYFIFLIIVTAFLWASLLVAKSLGAYGGAQAVTIGQNWGRGIRRGVSGGISGVAGRNTIGRIGDKWNQGMEKRGVSERNVFRGLASTMAGAKFGGSYSRPEARASREKATQKRARYEQLYGKQGSKAGEFVGGVVPAIAAGLAKNSSTKDKTTMERKISGLSSEQTIELLQEYKQGTPEYGALVSHMSDTQFKAVLKAKSEDIDDEVKDKLASDRRKSIESNGIAIEKAKDAAEQKKDPNFTLRTNEQIVAAAYRNFSDPQLKAIGADEIAKHAADLKQASFDKIMKSDDYTETEKELIRSKREEVQIERFHKEGAGAFSSLKDQEIAKLPKEILTDEKATPLLTGGALEQIISENSLSAGDRNKIAGNIQNNKKKADATAVSFLVTPRGLTNYQAKAMPFTVGGV